MTGKTQAMLDQVARRVKRNSEGRYVVVTHSAQFARILEARLTKMIGEERAQQVEFVPLSHYRRFVHNRTDKEIHFHPIAARKR